MSKRLLSLLLTLALCFSMLPSAALAETADAAAEETQNVENNAGVYTVGEDTVLQSGEEVGGTEKALYAENTLHEHPICGDDSCTDSEHKLPDDAEWVGVSTLYNEMAAGYYYLTDEVKLDDPWDPLNDVTLCLNGHSINASSFANVINVRANKTVTLCDCDTQGRGSIVNTEHDNGCGVYLNSSTLNLYGGTVTGKKYGVNVAQPDSTFNMHGGTIKNSGTGVYVSTKGKVSFNMTGGTITGSGTGAEYAGGVYVGSGLFKMSGGSITQNRTGEKIFGSGGVYVGGGTFEMGGNAVISDNSITIKESNSIYFTSAGAGGVYVGGGTFKMSGNAKVTGNSITNNSTKDVVGGVYIGAKDTITMTVSDNASVSGNTGGNVYLAKDKSIAIDGELGETAAIGVSIPALAEGGSATVVTGAKEADLDRFSDDSGNYKKKYADGNIIFADAHEHPICGDKNCTDSEHGLSDGTEWVGVNGLDQIVAGTANAPKYYYLTADIELTATWSAKDNAVLCLNGHSITVTTGDATEAISVYNVTFTLTDCNGSNSTYKFTKNETDGLWKQDADGALTVTGGIITHADGSTGRAVTLNDNSTFNMYSGTLCGNSGYPGGGVNVSADTGVFNMHGGTICGNIADWGGGVINFKGTFKMDGGTIHSNTAYTGGGVYNWNIFDMSGGTVTGNTATSKGGGVYLISGGYSYFTMSGNAAITGNTATGDGGGAYLDSGTFTMNGGTISDNSAQNGGGVYANNIFHMNDGDICDNTATCDGGGVYVDLGSAFTMEDGTIGSNIANNSGGGVGVHGGRFTLKNGSISGNTAKSYGGGVDVYSGSFTMRGGSITGNSVTDTDSSFGSGAGVDVYEGAFTMTGGSITGNSATNNGGGVEVISNGSMIVSGSVQITNNWQNGTPDSASGVYVKGDNGKVNNLYLGYNRTVTVGKDGLNTDARIGVITSDDPTSGSPIKIATDAMEEESYYTNIFIPEAENSDYTITKKTDNALYLSAHEHNWTYTADDTTHTITAKCSKCSMGGGSTTLTKPEHSKYGDGKDIYAQLTPDNWRPELPANALTYKKGNETVSNPTGAGDYTVSLTIGDATVSVDYTIKKAQLTVTANGNTVTYGDAPADKGVTYKGFVNDEDESVLNGSLNYTFSYDPRYSDIGLHIITPDGLTSDNYEIDFVSGTMTVTQREVMLTWSNTENRTYGDGKIVGAAAGNLVNGDDIGVDITGGDKTGVGTHNATATGLTGSKAKNYKLPDDNTKLTVTYIVNKGKLENKELTMPVYKGVHKTYEYDFANELPTLAEGLTFGNIQYEGTLSDDFDKRWIIKGNVVLSGSKLSITTFACDEGSQVLEYVVTVKSDNYEDFTMTLKVNAEDKKMADLQIDITPWSYGSGGFNEPVVRNEPADAKWISTVYKNKATGKEIIPNGKTDDAGEYTVTVRYESDDTVYIGTKDFIINPRHLDRDNVVVPAGVTADKIYDGTTDSDLTELAIEKGMLVTEEDGALRIVGTSEYTNPNAGATRLAFTTDGTIRLSDSSSSAKPSNYSTSPTKLTALFEANILQRELAFTATGVSKIYGSDDASAEVAVSFLPVSGRDKTGLVDGETLVQGVDYDVKAVFSKTEVGEDSNVRVIVTLKDTQKAHNYKLNTSEITVTGTIKPKPIPVLDGDVTLTPAEITYGEQLSKIKISGTMKVGNTTVEGDFTWQNPDETPEAGTYWGDWRFTPKDNKTYAETVGRAQITVNKAKQSAKLIVNNYIYGETPKTPTLSERTGDLSAEVTYYYSSADDGTGNIWDIGNHPKLNAGTYNMRAVISGTKNYNSFITDWVEFEVEKATPTYTKPTGLTAIYGQTLGDIMISNPAGNLSGVWSWMDSTESVGDAAIAAKTFKAKFTPTDNINYNMVENIELEVTVNKADGNNLKTEELSQKYTYTSEYTYTPDWSALPDGQTWSYNCEYSVGGGSAAKLTKNFAPDGSLLTYAVSDGTAGDMITVTLKASCANYEDYTITLHITLADRDEQAALYVTGDNTVVYGQTLQLGNEGGSGTGKVTYTVTNDSGEATIDPDTGILTPIKVGTVKVTATKAGDDDYKEVASAPFEITITQATSTGEPKYTKITTGGKTLNDAALTTEDSTLNPNAGRLEWLDDEGNVLPNDTKVEANKTYKWRFTPDDGNYAVLTGEVELYHVSSGGGGGTTRYTVSFETNGGNKISSERVKRNSTLTEPTAPTKEGFDFAGWYTDKDLKTKYDFSAKVTKSITLYAAWTKKDNSINQIILTIGEKAAQVFGQIKTNDVAPKIVNDRTMLPARFVAENLGADVSWDGEKELVTIVGKNLKTSEDVTILIYIGSDIAYVNGKEFKLDSVAFVENDRTYTPIRFISEELGASVEWIESEQKVVISK